MYKEYFVYVGMPFRYWFVLSGLKHFGRDLLAHAAAPTQWIQYKMNCTHNDSQND